MSTVDPEEVMAAVTETRERFAALASEVEALKDAIKAESSPETFRAYFTKHAELGRQELRLSLLEKWATDLGVEVAA